MPFSDHAMDQFIAPHLSEFTSADIPDLEVEIDQGRFWIYSYILNAMLRGRTPSPDHEFRFTALRKATQAFATYLEARERTLAYVGDLHAQRFDTYFAAVERWEAFLSAAWQSLSAIRQVNGGGDWFNPGDGSLYQRVNSLYNQSKHTESRIAAGQMPPSGPLAVWLNSDGLASTEAALSFREAAQVMRDLGTYAYVLEDPTTSRERHDEMLALSQGEA